MRDHYLSNLSLIIIIITINIIIIIIIINNIINVSSSWWFVIVASDGLWRFLSDEEACSSYWVVLNGMTCMLVRLRCHLMFIYAGCKMLLFKSVHEWTLRSWVSYSPASIEKNPTTYVHKFINVYIYKYLCTYKS
jgi:hypothetical protein